MSSDNILRTPTEWSYRLGITILDPDGWRGKDGRNYLDPIDEDEYFRRMSVSTTYKQGPVDPLARFL
ncbi:hypothetical protein CJ179_38635 [Rhodococcus sp. ACS1]|uniref:hypothetical protein n=1 Tax=Rhodococcus sp. ACS1 TaxID=2028570 RepID=UPI000BB0E779|nr:hypothetical protein [Rhodococcus sp. ACS1]PBC38518.1 hypothetical protein CJ179_38635 [Rhodococcus sp. ACS1]